MEMIRDEDIGMHALGLLISNRGVNDYIFVYELKH